MRYIVSYIICILGLTIGLCHVNAQSNVDTKIAVNSQTDDKTFVIIISNENYKHEESVPFARNDGEVFKVYCQKTLGIPESNIRFVPDATLNEMNFEIDWLDDVLRAYEGEARAIFYYTGHGMPDESSKEAYLLPIDGYSKSPQSGLSTKKLYQKLGKMQTQSIVVFMDACFSGAKRDGKMLASSRGVAIKAKDEPVGNNTVVFSAAQGDETAYPYKSQQHGMFTYYVLEKLQQSGGATTLGELSQYVTQQVKRKSVVENGKSQTPSVTYASNNQNWRDWQFASTAATKYESIAKIGSRKQEQPQTSPKQQTKIMLKRDIPLAEPEEETNMAQTSSGVIEKKPSLRLGFADWYGGVKNGKPDGFGTMVFRQKHQIDSNDPDKNVAENGDRIEGTYNNGHLEQGTWFKVNGESELLLIGL